MKEQTRDKLLLAMAVALFDLLDKNPSTLCRLQSDKSDLRDAIEDMRKTLIEEAWNQ